MNEPPKTKLWFYQWFIAMVGATVIGVSLPAILVSVNCGTKSVFSSTADCEPVVNMPMEARVRETARLIVAATFVCGPLALVLGSILLSYTRALSQSGTALAEVIRTGMKLGIVASFLNVPAWGVRSLIPAVGAENWIKAILLFAVAGSSAGAWIGWQAWRTEFPGTPLIPSFSLKVLMIVVIAWGGLLAIFYPR